MTPPAIAPASTVGSDSPQLRSAVVRLASCVLIALVGVIGLVASPAPEALSAANGVVDETQSAAPVANSKASSDRAETRVTRQRRHAARRCRRNRAGAGTDSKRRPTNRWWPTTRQGRSAPPGRAPPRHPVSV